MSLTSQVESTVTARGLFSSSTGMRVNVVSGPAASGSGTKLEIGALMCVTSKYSVTVAPCRDAQHDAGGRASGVDPPSDIEHERLAGRSFIGALARRWLVAVFQGVAGTDLEQGGSRAPFGRAVRHGPSRLDRVALPMVRSASATATTCNRESMTPPSAWSGSNTMLFAPMATSLPSWSMKVGRGGGSVLAAISMMPSPAKPVPMSASRSVIDLGTMNGVLGGK